MSEPVRAEWASGKRGPVPTSLLLLFFGGVTLLIIGVLASQGLVGGLKGFPLNWSITAVAWSVVAILLALATRRRTSKPLELAALIWWLPFLFIVVEGSRLGLF